MASYQRVTLAEISARLLSRTDGLSIFWTSTELRDAVNEALRLWQALTGYWTTTFTVPTDGQVYLGVPSQITTTQRLQFNGNSVTLDSLAERDYGNPGWEAAASGTTLYWSPIGINLVAFNPPPSPQGYLVFEGVMETPQLTNSSDYINIGDEELTRVLEYAQHYLAFKEGSPEFDSTLGGFKNFMEAAGVANTKLRDTAAYKNVMGLPRDESERPAAAGKEIVGVRNL